MTGAAAALVPDQGAARLDVRRTALSDLAPLCRALIVPSWLGQPVEPPPGRPEVHRVETDLALSLGPDGGLLTFRKAALVDVGPPRPTSTGCSVEIGWQAATFAPLFPVFAGRLEASGTSLRLHGFYAPPGGSVGLVIDRAFLHRFAFRTAGWFLDRLLARAEELYREGEPSP